MKMLEKVVKALEICGKADPSMCPYFDTKHWVCCTGHIQGYSPVKDDAYSYLREFLNYQKSQKMVNKTDSLSDTENKPLDWNELKSMVGKPVWVEHNLFKGWRLVGWQANEHLMVLVGPYSEQLPLFVDGCCTDWKAYKKELG